MEKIKQLEPHDLNIATLAEKVAELVEWQHQMVEREDDNFLCPHKGEDGRVCLNKWPIREGDICPKCHKNWKDLL